MGLGPNDRRLSAYHIRRACEASLRRLQTDHIDLYQMHHVDRATPWEEIWQAMEQLVGQGKISYVGSSNFAAWDVALAQCAASARHLMGLTSEQSLYNLAVRTVELELIPALRSLGIGLIPYSPLHAGLLPAVLGTATEGRISDNSTTTASRRTATSSKPMKGCAGSLALSPWTWRWPGYCATLSSPPRSSERRRPRSCEPTSARYRCSWTPKSRNDSTRSGPGRAGGSTAGVRLVTPTPTPATGPCSPDKACGNPGAILGARRHERPPTYPHIGDRGRRSGTLLDSHCIRTRTSGRDLRICECRCGAPGWRTSRLGVGDPTWLSLRIRPLRRALHLTCPSWWPAPAWPTSWPDQKPVRSRA